MIKDVMVKELKPIADERGMLMELLRNDDKIFKKFGQIYMTTAYPGVVKSWHYHEKQTDNFICISGMVKLVIYDSRKDEINEFFLGMRNPKLVQIPPLLYHGFKCVSQEEALMINIPSEPYNHKKPDEYRLPWDDPSIPYNWERKNG